MGFPALAANGGSWSMGEEVSIPSRGLWVFPLDDA